MLIAEPSAVSFQLSALSFQHWGFIALVLSPPNTPDCIVGAAVEP
jgi:hypothetical protein